MESARAPHVIEFAANFCNALTYQPPVGFDLRLARAAQESEPAALALEMSPAPDQPAALVCEVCEFDLEAAFARTGAFAKNLQNEGGAIKYFCVPGLLEIALLHRCQRGIDNDHVGRERASLRGNLVHLAFADERGWPRFRKRRNVFGENAKPDRGGKPCCLGESRFRVAARLRRIAPFGLDMQNKRGRARARIAASAFPASRTQAVSSAAVSVS
jgi:hypothetical protein